MDGWEALGSAEAGGVDVAVQGLLHVNFDFLLLPHETAA